MSDMPSRQATIVEACKVEPQALKQCCAAIYASDAARLLLGDTFHPGGTKLTERLSQILNLNPRTRLLDVAAGKGGSAFFLAERFGCDVVGVDYSLKNVDTGNKAANAKRLNDKVTFQCADAEMLPFPDDSFDAVICECAFCTFPDKQSAAREFNRVLRPGGQVGISDLTRDGALAPDLEGLMSWIACIAGARPLSDYITLLSSAEFTVTMTEKHNGALTEFVDEIRARLLAAEVMVRLRKVVLPGFDFEVAKGIVKYALEAIRKDSLGYAVVAARKSPLPGRSA
jgi:arsenite methyltransferase